jgi:hypothetical protein
MKRNLQFSLRRMLIWTAVVAAWLGLSKTLGGGATGLATQLCFILLVGVVGLVRSAFGSWTSFVLWVVLAAIPGVLTLLASLIRLVAGSSTAGMEPTESLVLSLVILVATVGVFGPFSYLFLEAFFRFVDWADGGEDGDD